MAPKDRLIEFESGKAPEDPEMAMRWTATHMMITHLETCFTLSGSALAVNSCVSALYSWLMNKREHEKYPELAAETARVLRVVADMIENGDNVAKLAKVDHKDLVKQ